MPTTTLRLLPVRALLLLGVVLGAVALATVLTPAASGGHQMTTLGGAQTHPARGVVWN